ncbi:MAG: TetR/AcrR family transcriptional regulator [Desulfarculaceae bacterium]|jgi:AcrR family transcriptional regulator
MAEMQSPTGKVAQRRREVLLRLREEGLRLMGQKGINACRVEQVTQAAGVSKGAFFTYFNSKQAFVADLVDQTLSELARRVAPVVLSPPDAESVLSAVLSVHLRFFHLQPQAAVLINQACHPGLGNAQAGIRLRRHIDEVAELISPAGQSLGWPRPQIPGLALSIFSLSCGLTRFSLGLGLETPPDFKERLGKAMARGLAAPV